MELRAAEESSRFIQLIAQKEKQITEIEAQMDEKERQMLESPRDTAN